MVHNHPGWNRDLGCIQGITVFLYILFVTLQLNQSFVCFSAGCFIVQKHYQKSTIWLHCLLKPLASLCDIAQIQWGMSYWWIQIHCRNENDVKQRWISGKMECIMMLMVYERHSISLLPSQRKPLALQVTEVMLLRQLLHILKSFLTFLKTTIKFLCFVALLLYCLKCVLFVCVHIQKYSVWCMAHSVWRMPLKNNEVFWWFCIWLHGNFCPGVLLYWLTYVVLLYYVFFWWFRFSIVLPVVLLFLCCSIVILECSGDSCVTCSLSNIVRNLPRGSLSFHYNVWQHGSKNCSGMFDVFVLLSLCFLLSSFFLNTFFLAHNHPLEISHFIALHNNMICQHAVNFLKWNKACHIDDYIAISSVVSCAISQFASHIIVLFHHTVFVWRIS